MKIIQICPKCGLPGVKVNKKAVMYNLRKSEGVKSDVKLRWSICINPGCDCSYFSRNKVFSSSDLAKPLFYKDKSDNVPICYCSDLTRGEIKDAIKEGCKTIKDVQTFTKKNITGHCEERNPLGKCCKQVFLKVIKDEMEL